MAARVTSNGTIDPLGRKMACTCAEPTLHILSMDDPADDQ